MQPPDDADHGAPNDARYGDRKAVARANRAFYDAFERLDLDAMRAVWLADARVRCIHPGGEALVGPESVHGSWARIFASTARIRFEIVDLSIDVAADTAWVGCIERIQARYDDDELVSEAVATNLFERSGDDWRLLLHHASPIARRFDT